MDQNQQNTTAHEDTVLVNMRNIVKIFGPVVALGGVDLTVHRGQVLGLIGENGSGKSTISSILAGMQSADSGDMFFRGKPWHPVSMHDALRQGIGMIVQESGTVPGITVAENLFLCDTARFSGRRGRGLINGRALRRAAQAALDDIGASHIRADAITGSLDLQDRKLVEVARVWLARPDVMIVDETTTALSQTGRDIIGGLIRRMADSRRAVIFISHDLDEIKATCNRLTILRDGHIIRSFEKADYDDEEIRQSMIGRKLEGNYYRADYDGSHSGKVALTVEHVSLPGALHNVSLTAYHGEILGIGGLSPCGMHPLGQIMFGARRPESGRVCIHGRNITDPSTAMHEGAGYAAKDRDVESLCTEASIRENIAIAGLSHLTDRLGFLYPGRERSYVQEQIDFMSIKCFTMEQPVSQLSGGNKQKVVFGKWIGRGSDILILDCPTRGIDIGVKQTMYQLLYKMKQEGKTIIMISEELPELLGMSDRLLILKDGRITAEFTRSPELSDRDIIGYMV